MRIKVLFVAVMSVRITLLVVCHTRARRAEDGMSGVTVVPVDPWGSDKGLLDREDGL